MKPDHQVISQLVSECGAALIALARNWTNSPEDLVQSAFAQLIQQEQLPGNPKAWLCQVVRNLGRQQIRGNIRRRRRESSVAKSTINFDEKNDRQRVELLGALGEVAIEKREVVIMRLWCNMNLKEISQVTGDSTSTVHRRYYQALEEVKKKLNANHGYQTIHERQRTTPHQI